MKIIQGLTVIIKKGKDQGKSGLVEKVFPQENKILLAGLNLAQKAVKPSKRNPQGGIISLPLKLSASNVVALCPNCNQSTIIKLLKQAKNIERICRHCQKPLKVKVSAKTK